MNDLEVTDGKTTLKVSIRSANITAGLIRGELQNAARVETDSVRWFARYWIYSACLACAGRDPYLERLLHPARNRSQSRGWSDFR